MIIEKVTITTTGQTIAEILGLPNTVITTDEGAAITLDDDVNNFLLTGPLKSKQANGFLISYSDPTDTETVSLSDGETVTPVVVLDSTNSLLSHKQEITDITKVTLTASAEVLVDLIIEQGIVI